MDNVLFIDFFFTTIHKYMNIYTTTYICMYSLTACSIIHMGISFWTAIVRLYDVCGFQKKTTNDYAYYRCKSQVD